MKVFTAVVFLLLSAVANCQQEPLGIFDGHQDIGNPKQAGAAEYNASKQSYTLKGGGYNIWFNRDEFHYLYKKLAGDFILTANFEFLGDGGSNHRKIGWMIRPNSDESAAQICAVSHGDGLTVLQWRVLRGAYMRDPEDEIATPKKNFEIIQLERTGKTITMRVAHPGEPLQVVGSHDMADMPDSVLAGLFICAHDSATTEQARVWNVRIDKPVANSYNTNKSGYLPSRLEVLNIEDGRRKIIHHYAGRFEAPNWMPDGKNILFNQDGIMYKIPAEGGEASVLNTGAVQQCNNDHGISFDGKQLAISSTAANLPGGSSAVYVLPLAGGEPKLVTRQTPSYWHGWGPDGKTVLIVAQRGGSKIYNLYKVSTETGAETALTTNSTGHVDGPEFSPDGKYIYYNANPTGTMQLWRMKPDGSNKEQLTFDEYHNWFPHISPDGKWVAFISFPVDIDPDAHPFYKRVMLRVMPLTGPGGPKTVAYLFGGQGTFNAPSWSPDSKYLAFVSNSGQ